MKLEQLFESIAPNFTQLYHLTELSNVSSILKHGMLPKSSMRGATYNEQRLHFITSLDKDVVDEVLGLILFGGTDFDDEEIIATRQDVPVAILKLDVVSLQKFDMINKVSRVWKHDTAISENNGVYTTQVIPPQVLKHIKTINDG